MYFHIGGTKNRELIALLRKRKGKGRSSIDYKAGVWSLI